MLSSLTNWDFVCKYYNDGDVVHTNVFVLAFVCTVITVVVAFVCTVLVLAFVWTANDKNVNDNL